MTIAVMSDLHDNVADWQMIVQVLADKKISTLINCGDTCAPAMLKEMSQTFNGDIHTVFGNVADREQETALAEELKNVIHHGERGGVNMAGKRIGFNHFPAVAEAMARSGEFDLVCHGHTHLKRWEKIGECYILNPGTAGGMFQYPSIALVDLVTMTHDWHDLTL